MAGFTLVNELSNTMDLEATLIRAEHLFRRFRRLVDAIDHKHTFPPPRLQSPTQGSNQSTASASPSTDTGGSRPSAATPSRKNAGKAPETPAVERVITPELRKLLSRSVDIVPRKKPAVKTTSSMMESS